MHCLGRGTFCYLLCDCLEDQGNSRDEFRGESWVQSEMEEGNRALKDYFIFHLANDCYNCIKGSHCTQKIIFEALNTYHPML